MYIKSILIFISDLKKLKELIPCDLLLLDKLTAHIVHRSIDDELDSDDFIFLLECFKNRWLKIVDTENDYMVNSGVVNQRWIEFAKEVAPFTEKNYLQILVPTVANSLDFNNLTLLTDTVRLQNFYLGYGNQILYRKRGLCELLLQNNFLLATRRGINSSKLCAMTVEEMSRLEACKQNDGQFLINEEQFADFWDFLRRKVFPQLHSAHLKSKEEMPWDLLVQLLLLIEQYYTLKESRDSYKSFNDLVSNFFKSLYKNKIQVINFFYGMMIPDTSLYLLDFLIVIYKADSYVLDDHLKILMKWLYQFHPSLRLMNEEWDSFYNKLQMTSGAKTSTSLVRVKNKSECLLDQCLGLLLSLYTTEFDFIPFTGRVISFWDISRTVFAEAAEIYSLLAPLLEKNKIEELLVQYQKVIKDYIMPGMIDSSIFTWVTRFKRVGDWYIHVKNKTLSQLGVNWFQPELIIHALLRYKASDSYARLKINEFLDELIHTYTQNNFELQKQLRVNILFTDFINSLPFHDQNYLRILLQIYDKHDAKNKFLNNCISHILNRLSEISIIKTKKPLHFFASVHKVDASILDISHICSNELQTVIEAFKNKLFSSDLKIDGELLKKMEDYLRLLNRPIITFKERQDAINGANTLGYVGGYT